MSLPLPYPGCNRLNDEIQANTDPNGGNPYPVLAVNKDSDSFSLCKSTSGDSSGQDIIIYEASESSTDYDFSSCVPVHIQLIGLD